MELQRLRNRLPAEQLGVMVLRETSPKTRAALKSHVTADGGAVWLQADSYFCYSRTAQDACLASANTKADLQALWRDKAGLQHVARGHIGKNCFKGNEADLKKALETCEGLRLLNLGN